MDALPFASMSLQQALALVPATDLVRWNLSVPPRLSSDVLLPFWSGFNFLTYPARKPGKFY